MNHPQVIRVKADEPNPSPYVPTDRIVRIKEDDPDSWYRNIYDGIEIEMRAQFAVSKGKWPGFERWIEDVVTECAKKSHRAVVAAYWAEILRLNHWTDTSATLLQGVDALQLQEIIEARRRSLQIAKQNFELGVPGMPRFVLSVAKVYRQIQLQDAVEQMRQLPAVEQIRASLASGFDEVVAVLKWPTRPVRDDKGEIIGAVREAPPARR